MMFLNALVHHAGSTAAAGRALQALLEAAGVQSPALHAWARGLAKPEQAAGGPGEDPWEDLPVASMPGFEQERRRRQDQEAEREDQLFASRGDCRCCPNCGKVIEKNAGCDQMTCGAHAHTQVVHGEGCGHTFSWSQAPRYRPQIAAEQRQPPGFSAILSWVQQQHDFTSPAAVAAADAALHGLSPEDRRYAFGNACGCAFAKRNRTQAALAEALTSNNQPLLTALGFSDQRLPRVAAVLCDAAGRLPASQSLVAAVFLGRDDWEQVAGNGENQSQRLKNTMINLLVTVLGSPDNNHLSLLLLDPNAMLNSFPVGFVYGAMPGPEGYHFDCGCVLDTHGRARRSRPPLTNAQLHLVNFCSWSMLALGLWIFPELCENITQVLTEGYIREVDGGRPGPLHFADSVRSFAMNFALQSFECVCRHQGLTEEDRSLAFSHLFQDFRRRSAAASPEFQRCFATAEARQRYEQSWAEMIDGVMQNLPELRRQALQDSQAQSQLLRLQQFRSSLSYMQHFFHDYEKCTVALPVEAELEFVSALVNRREELSHLPLLGHYVRIRNWIFDRLDGALPEKCLKEPLKKLLQRAMQKDEEMKHRSKKSQCEATLRSLKLFVESWRAFYDANNGAIPIECQAGRAAMGMAAQETRLVQIGEEGEDLPLSFFLSAQPQMVGKFLCNSWNELVDAAATALDEQGKSHATNWAQQMKKAAPVHVADLFFQEHLVETLQSRAVQRSVLRNLRPRGGPAWQTVQLEILNGGWIHRIQKLDFPEMEEFRSAKLEEKFSTTEMALSEQKQEEVLDKLARLQLVDLQVSRDWLRQILPRLGSSEASMMVLDHKDIRDQRSSIPQAALDLLDGIPIVALSKLLQLLDEENGEFGHHLSPLLKAASPIDLQRNFYEFWVRPSDIKAGDLKRRDEVLRETITNLEHEPFCEHATSHASMPLREMYDMVYAPDETPLSGLPDQIQGCHLLAVLQGLRSLLRELRCRKAKLDEGKVWDPQQGLKALPPDLILTEEKPWYEAALNPEPDAHQNEPASDLGSLWTPNLDVLAFMCWACQESKGGDYLTELCMDPSVAKLLVACGFDQASDDANREECIHRLLDCYEKQMASKAKEGGAAWQRSLSVQLVPLQSLLAYKDTNSDAVKQELWHIAESKLDPETPGTTPLLANAWHRFLETFVIQSSGAMEDALRRVLQDKMPKIVHVPREAEDLALSGQEIILKYRDLYFEVKSNVPSDSAPDAGSVPDGRWASLKASQIQRRWRSFRARQAKSAPPEPPEAQNAAVEEVLQEVLQEVSRPTSPAEKFPESPAALPTVPDTHEEPAAVQAEPTVAGYPATQSPSDAAALSEFERLSELEEVRSVRSVQSMASQASKWTMVGGEDVAWKFDRFILKAEYFSENFFRDPIDEAAGSFAGNFQAAMRNGGKLLKDSIIPTAQHLRRKHGKGALQSLGLTQDELLALVAVTKNYPKVEGHMDFAEKLSFLVLNVERESKEMNACIYHFKTALEKCRAVSDRPSTLYCVARSDCRGLLDMDEEVLWPTYTSWTANKEAALQAASSISGFVVQLDAPHSACDVSVFRSEGRDATRSEFILPVNTPLTVKMVAEPVHLGEPQVAVVLEEVDDDDDSWPLIDDV